MLEVPGGFGLLNFQEGITGVGEALFVERELLPEQSLGLPLATLCAGAGT